MDMPENLAHQPQGQRAHLLPAPADRSEEDSPRPRGQRHMDTCPAPTSLTTLSTCGCEIIMGPRGVPVVQWAVLMEGYLGGRGAARTVHASPLVLTDQTLQELSLHFTGRTLSLAGGAAQNSSQGPNAFPPAGKGTTVEGPGCGDGITK